MDEIKRATEMSAKCHPKMGIFSPTHSLILNTEKKKKM
jgi:hypothetical protein